MLTDNKCRSTIDKLRKLGFNLEAFTAIHAALAEMGAGG